MILNVLAIIGCVVGVITCVIGVATFVSATISRAKSDGRMFEKIDQIHSSVEEMKQNMKERDREVRDEINSHSRDIIKLQTQMKIILPEQNKEGEH